MNIKTKDYNHFVFSIRGDIRILASLFEFYSKTKLNLRSKATVIQYVMEDFLHIIDWK